MRTESPKFLTAVVDPGFLKRRGARSRRERQPILMAYFLPQKKPHQNETSWRLRLLNWPVEVCSEVLDACALLVMFFLKQSDKLGPESSTRHNVQHKIKRIVQVRYIGRHGPGKEG